jgi:hypothetical protein
MARRRRRRKNPLKSGSSRATISHNISKLHREHPDWPQKRVVAAALNNARRTGRGKRPKYLRRRARENPTSALYWILGGLVALGLGGVAYYFYRKSQQQNLQLTAQGNGTYLFATVPLPTKNGKSVTPPPPPAPTGPVNTAAGLQQYLNTLTVWVRSIQGLQLTPEATTALYSQVQTVLAQNYNVALPAPYFQVAGG